MMMIIMVKPITIITVLVITILVLLYLHITTSAERRKVIFSSFLVCLPVCIDRFPCGFQDSSDMAQWTIWKILEMLLLTSWIKDFFAFHWGNPWLLITLRKMDQMIFMKLSGWVQYGARNKMQHLGNVVFKPIGYRIWKNSGSTMSAILRTSGWTDF